MKTKMPSSCRRRALLGSRIIFPWGNDVWPRVFDERKDWNAVSSCGVLSGSLVHTHTAQVLDVFVLNCLSNADFSLEVLARILRNVLDVMKKMRVGKRIGI